MGFFLKKSGIINYEIYLSTAKYMFKYSTGLKINPVSWDKITQRPKLQRGEQGAINKEITHTLNEYAQVLDILKKEHGKGLTGNILKIEFNRHFKNIEEKKTETYNDYYELYIKQKNKAQSVLPLTLKKYARTHNAILKLAKKKKTTFYLTDFNSDFFIEFISFLRANNISDNTLRRQIGFFKTFLNWCLKNNYKVNTDFKDVQVKTRETYHVSLTEADLEVLENLELPERQGYFRDQFLIGCYSGQRHSDYSRFNKNYIDGNKIVIRAKKTGQFSYIPLNPRLKRLLDKYDWILPTINLTNFNIHIHAFCKAAGFNEVIVRDKFYGNKKVTEEIPRYKLIASHTARRTFITLSEEKGVPASATMNVCGIKDIKTYQNYIRLNKESMAQAVIKAWS
jgi:site-specific recombinase XerD